MEGLAPLIFFAIIGLVQLLVRWLRAAQRQQQQQRPPAPMPEEEADVPRRFPPAARPPATRLPIPAPLPPPRVLINDRMPDDEELMVRTPARVAATAAAPPPSRRMQRLDLRLGNRAEVRRAIVLMEILGPPRGTASDEVQGSR